MVPTKVAAVRRIGAVLCLGLGVGGCESTLDVGQGSGPIGLVVVASGGNEFSRIYECRSEALAAYAIFSGDGDPSLNQVNADWLSDNPGILAVSNNDLLSARGFVMASGSVVARAPGTAVITARYLDFTASVTIEVLPILSLEITPALTDIAEDLPQEFELEATFDDGEPAQTISSEADWRLNGATSAAYIEKDSHTVSANSAAPEPITLVAELRECGLRTSRELRVSATAGVEVDYEFGATSSLPVGVSEAWSVWATFAAPTSTRQNLTALIDVDNAFDETVATYADEYLYVQTNSESRSVQLTLSLPANRWSATTRPTDYVATDLLSIEVQPQLLELNYPERGQLEALGRFANGQVLPVTRHVTWSSGDVSALSVGNGTSVAGQIFAGRVDQDVVVTASAPQAAERGSDSALVKLYIPR